MSTFTKKHQSKSRTCYNSNTDAVFASVFAMLGKNMDKAMITANYQPAILSIEHNMWRIVWYNRHPATNNLQRIRKTFNLNRVKSKSERRRLADKYVNLINEALRAGWNFFIHTTDTAVTADVVTITQALYRALPIRKLGMKPRTAESYASYVNKLCEWMEREKLNALPVADFTAEHFQSYILYKSAEGHKNRNINDHINFFKTTFDVIRKKLKLISANPVADFDYLPKTESSRFQPITPEELARIVPALIEYNPRFYLFCKFIPDEYLRPHHIARLKGRDINYGTNELHTGGETVKTGRKNTKQLMQGLKDMLLKMDYDKLPGNWYLFATRDFAPGARLYTRLSIRAAELWREIVIEGLGIDKQMYALKHTSAQYFVNNNANVDVYYLRQQLEHANARETEIYLQRQVKKKIDEKEVKTLKF